MFLLAALRRRKYYDLAVPLTENPNVLVSETSSFYLEQIDG
jgi:hypothetical protein